MNLISGEAVNNLEKSDTKGSDYDRGWNDALCAVDMLPSAFEGMTNGEVIKALFPNANYESCQNFMQITSANICGSTLIWEEWWNAPYKAESEVKPNE